MEMRRPHVAIAAAALAFALVSGSAAASDLDGFLKELDIRASADLGAFKADLSVTFGASGPQLEGLFQVFSDPSDVYMTLRLGELAKRPVEQVVAEYQSHKGQGWGVIAQNLGIKPGSSEFHALKANRLGSAGSPSGKPDKGHGKGKG